MPVGLLHFFTSSISVFSDTSHSANLALALPLVHQHQHKLAVLQLLLLHPAPATPMHLPLHPLQQQLLPLLNLNSQG